MDLEQYKNLTGKTIADGDKTSYEAIIRRSNALLESALGYSLAPSKNLDKTEVGKVQQINGFYPVYPIVPATFLPADTQEGVYRLFPYNENDVFIKTDPYLNVYHVKLVKPLNDNEFITYVDLNDYASKQARKFGKYIERQAHWFTWSWYPQLLSSLGRDDGLLIAVDGDWITCKNMPSDLAYLWADMVTYYSDENYSVSGSLKSESVSGHSWSRTNAGGGKGVDLSPEQSATGVNLIARYAGPNGSLATRIPTI